MTRLPYDYCRCAGVAGAQLCSRCARTQPGREVWQAIFSSPPLLTGSLEGEPIEECEYFIDAGE